MNTMKAVPTLLLYLLAHGSTVSAAPPAAPVPTSLDFANLLGGATLAQAKKAAAAPVAVLDAAYYADLAKALFVLINEAGGSAEANNFSAYAANRKPMSAWEMSPPMTGIDIAALAFYFKASFWPPCLGGKVSRTNSAWPPKYKCDGEKKPAALPGTVERVVTASIYLMPKPPEQPKETATSLEPPQDANLKNQRLSWVNVESMKDYVGNSPITQDKFWVGGSSYGAYVDVASALYGRKVSGNADDAPPVFCAPVKTVVMSEDPQWGGSASAKLTCYTDWMMTEKADWSCLGSPAFLGNIIVPGMPKNGFLCRNRLFRVLKPTGPGGAQSKTDDIKAMCNLLRAQTWGEKVAGEVAEAQAKAEGKPYVPIAEPQVYRLTREEVLYFFGNRSTYCRANRPLTHSKFNTTWAASFTCGVPRGLFEAGPMEEGVQVCAVSPYTDKVFDQALTKDVADPHKGRLHCWMFNRPACEQLADDKFMEEQVYKSDVFDGYDVFQEMRRTQGSKVAAYKKLQDAQKVKSFDETRSFSDAIRDDGEGGVTEFCRLVGDNKTLVCGYDRKSVAQWYEVRAHEQAEGCGDGICDRGAYQRGYLCGLHTSQSLYDGKRPVWVCGFDRGPTGVGMLKAAEHVCTGGKWVKDYRLSNGSTDSLQCNRRLFRWGESQESAKKASGYKQLLADVTTMWLAKLTGKVGLEQYSAVKALLGDKVWDLDSYLDALKKGIQEFLPKFDPWGFLGHRTSMRRYFYEKVASFKSSPDVALQKVYNSLIGGLGKGYSENSKKIPEVSDLFNSVLSLEIAPDGKWMQAVRAVMTDEQGKLKDGHISALIHAYASFVALDYLEAVRQATVARALSYADMVISGAKAAEKLTRLEILGGVKVAPIAPEVHGTAFCSVNPAELLLKQPTFICGASPLLLAGVLERIALDRVPNYKPLKGVSYLGDSVTVAKTSVEEQKVKAKREFSAGWCYGAVPGEASEVQFKASSLAAAYEFPWRVVIPGYFKADGFLRCETTQYNDEIWYTALKKDEKQLIPVDKDPTEEVNNQVNGMGSPVLDWLIARLGDLQAVMDDLANFTPDFLDKYIDKAKGVMKKLWDDGEKKIADVEKAIGVEVNAVEKARELRDKAVEALIGVAGPQLEVLKKKRQDAEAALKKAQETLKSVSNGIGKVKADVEKFNQAIQEPGKLVEEILNELATMLTDRLSRFVVPKAKELLAKGFRMLRGLLKPVEQGAIALVSGIPFAGSALAVAVSVAFDKGLTMLEDWVTEKLIGIVERYLAKGLRAVLGPTVKVVKDLVLKGLRSLCSNEFARKEICPKKFANLGPRYEWLERSLACTKMPRIGPREIERSQLAERRLRSIAAEMQVKAVAWTRRLTNRHLAQFGHTHDSWMALFASTASDALKAQGLSVGPVASERIAASTRKMQQRLDAMRERIATRWAHATP